MRERWEEDWVLQASCWYPWQIEKKLEEGQVCGWQVASRCRINTSLLMSTLGSIAFPFSPLLPYSFSCFFLSFSLFPFSEGLSSVSGTGATEGKVKELPLSSNSCVNRSGWFINSYEVLRQVLYSPGLSSCHRNRGREVTGSGVFKQWPERSNISWFAWALLSCAQILTLYFLKIEG